MFGKEMRDIWDVAMRLLANLLSLAWDNIKLIFENVIKKILDKFKHIDWAQVGRDIINGIINGLLSLTVKLDSTIQKIAKGMVDAVQGFMGIHSPSSLMEMQVGVPMAQGVVVGWEQGLDQFPVSLGGIPGFTSPSFAGLTSVAAETVRGGAGGVSIVVPIEYKPFVSTADEREARTRLAPIIIDVIREYLNR